VGDFASTAIGASIFFEARRLNVPKTVQARMLINLVLDWLIGLVPLIDIIFDVAYKANLRNAQLLEAALSEPPP
jgi:hypothetical protein